MKIEKLELTVPQRRLMEIFADYESAGRFCDKRVRKLLIFLNELIHEGDVPVKTLENLLDGTLPPINFYSLYDRVMREVHDCDNDCYVPTPDELSLEDYQESLLHCFPEVFSELLATPREMIPPNENLILTWELGCGRIIREEIWYTSEEIRKIANLITDYVECKAYNSSSITESFFNHWTHYILTNDWPDKSKEQEKKIAEMQEYSDSQDKVIYYLSKKNIELNKAIENKYITISKATRALLTAVMEKKPLDGEINSYTKRISRKVNDLAFIDGKQNSKFYLVNDILPFFQNDKQLNMTDEEVLNILLNNATPQSDIS